jgi:Na+-translocating ferredoxin:NAD+ oxidoreductase RnfA subunit
LLGFATLVIGVATILAYAIARGLLAPHSLEWSDVVAGILVSVVALSALGRLGVRISPATADP